jgi:hypothetical protein
MHVLNARIAVSGAPDEVLAALAARIDRLLTDELRNVPCASQGHVIERWREQDHPVLTHAEPVTNPSRDEP